MEKENSSNFLNCNMNWPSAEPPLNYSLPNQLQQQQQCFLTQFEPALSSISRLECFNDPTGVHLHPQQWSSAGCFGQQSLNSPKKLDLFSMVGHQKQQVLGPGESSDMVGHSAGLPRLGVGLPSFGGKFPLSETGVLPRGEEGELRCVRAESSASEQTASEGNSRKRRPFKVGEEGSSEAHAKRSRAEETTDGSWKDEVKPKVEIEEQKPAEGAAAAAAAAAKAKALETPKQDYIHVRARRGQATDAHSLAERVRREKISERMKFLQNLVPGCNKVTGKAVMLDEIINYVQSLQRQVEFLSMKLATVNPRLDINAENLLQKEMQQPSGSLSHPAYPIATFPFAASQGAAPLQDSHCSASPLTLMLAKRSAGVQPPVLENFADAGSQVGMFWEDDLHKVVQMGSAQNQEGGFPCLKLDG